MLRQGKGNADQAPAFPSISSKWARGVLAALDGNVLRFTEVRRALGSISPKALSAVLAAFNRDGLIERRHYPTIPPRVEYELTELGIKIQQLLSLFDQLAAQSQPLVDASRLRFLKEAELARSLSPLNGLAAIGATLLPSAREFPSSKDHHR